MVVGAKRTGERKNKPLEFFESTILTTNRLQNSNGRRALKRDGVVENRSSEEKEPR